MKIIRKNKVPVIEDVCGEIREMYNSANLSISVATITGKSISHKHETLEEVYFITKGHGKIFIGSENAQIQQGDLVPIPKNEFHHIETDQNEVVEVIVATYPKFDNKDVIKEVMS